jgi:hypothetical protein
MARSLGVFRRLDDDTSAFTVSPDGTHDVPCGRGKAKRVYTAQRSTGGRGITDPEYIHSEVNVLESWLARYSGYSTTKAQPHEVDQPFTFTFPMTNGEHHANALITGKAMDGRFVLTLSGSTDCLRVT